MFEALKLRKRVLELEEEISRLDRGLKNLEIQWGDTLDRLKSMAGRVYKERARAERAREEVEPEAHLSDEDVAGGQASLPGMSARAIAANQAILARRNRMRTPQ